MSNKTVLPSGRKQDNKINVSLNREVVEELAKLKDEMSDVVGYKLTYAQAIQHLIKSYNHRTV
jgi:dihydroneopterin aldolase